MIKENMTRGGLKVPNQFYIKQRGCKYYRHKDKDICMINRSGKIFLDENLWDFSQFQNVFRNKFLGMSSQEVKDHVASGLITLVDLTLPWEDR